MVSVLAFRVERVKCMLFTIFIPSIQTEQPEYGKKITFTTFWANQQTTNWLFFLFFLRKRFWHFKHNLHEMSKIVFSKKVRKYFSMSSAENFTQSAYHPLIWEHLWDIIQNVRSCFSTDMFINAYNVYYFQQMIFWNIFSYFYQKTGFDISCKLSPWNIKSCFLGKIRKNVINKSSAVLAREWLSTLNTK